MNEKEISEIRRRFRPDKSNITRIRGCYVNEQREIVTQFSQSLGLMQQEEAEELLAILKKTLSGTIGKNLIDIEFATRQVLEGEEHKLLMALRDSSLEDDDAVREFYGRVIQALNLEGKYLILLACDKYDVPYYAEDGEKQEDSSEVFSYFLCSICPVKLTKPALGYYASENTFRNIASDWIVSAPELGFLFPAFDDRSANIYNALYYSRNLAENHAEFVDAIFKTEIPMPAAEQKETFQSILSETIADDCNLDVVQTVHSELSGLIEEHKTNKEKEPLVISKETVKGVLKSCGVPETRVTAFEEKYDDAFGADMEISPRNIIDTKQFELRTPDVTIRVNPECSDLVDTRVINGVKYILIRADEGVEVNGVNIHIS
ncbi:DUF4317 domain-containing protein [Caproiciproducens galactitolivorans]|uniref:DUF4317 domain-containing protein n=1 Tax=Caproiciproducens galactitolivorans TaxID=642589 RepID=A0A4Z0YE08_9FIRM|nr:DUF4317 domain-containing protein [Caproiciproducens galactitolivorans]QEY35710.1 DUF4317 domain-containing protein [Caproiciproducens galactitolivorans]TGJ77441.1 hypothetical protein CAGA_08110 [Caproiciproducens galactitolivorans]